jgi:Amt family ammonium transporter
MEKNKRGFRISLLAGLLSVLLVLPAMAADETIAVDTGDTAFVLVSAALVMWMTPGLALFYGGMVRGKNVLNTIMQSFFIICFVSVLWILVGYSLAFGPDHGGLIGGLDWVGFSGVGPGSQS